MGVAYTPRDRRRQGRVSSHGKPPKTETIKVNAGTKDRIDKLWRFQKMPLGDKLDSILDQYETLTGQNKKNREDYGRVGPWCQTCNVQYVLQETGNGPTYICPECLDAQEVIVVDE